MQRLQALVFGLGVLFAPVVAGAHARLVDPMPRNPNADNKVQAEPCGVAGETRTANPSVFAPGQTITVSWIETIVHNGHYEIAISTDGDQNFTALVADIDDQDGATGTYDVQVTLPDQECENCTLRMMQFMQDTNTYYKSCADIAIRVGGGDGGPVSDGGPGADAGETPVGIGEPPGLCSVAVGGAGGSAWSFLLVGGVLGGLLVARRRRG